MKNWLIVGITLVGFFGLLCVYSLLTGPDQPPAVETPLADQTIPAATSPSLAPSPSMTRVEKTVTPTVTTTSPAPEPATTVITTSPVTKPISTTPTGSLVPGPSQTLSFGPFDGIADVTTSNATITRDYKWDYGGSEWTWSLDIPQTMYDYYKALPRAPTDDYSIYITHPFDDKLISSLVDKLNKAADQKGYSEYEKVSFAAAFVQSLTYTSDLVTTGYDEYPRYPVETLVDDGGDCEDTAILTASIVKAMGYDVALLVFSKTANSPGHCAVGIAGEDGLPGNYWEHGGRKYYYLETTGSGWGIGESPPEYQGASAYVYPMIPVPVLTSSWTTDASGLYLKLEISAENLGSAAAQGVYMYAGFDAGNDQCWNSKQSSEFDLDIGGSATVTLYLVPPNGKHTRLVVQIIYGGYSVEESYSKWFDT